MDGNSEQLQVINLKQLPIIEERLRDVKAKIEQRTSAVMALAVTEETRTDVKKIRTEVRKELEGYEAQRMAVKKAIMTPYEQFEAVYKECVSNPYKAADEALGKKIADVEVGIKQQKEDDVRAFFTELTSGFGLDWLKFEQMNLKVTLTCTPKAMKAAITQSVTKIVRDCAALEENPDRDEIIGTVSAVDKANLAARVIFKDENIVSGWLPVLQRTGEIVTVATAGKHDHDVDGDCTVKNTTKTPTTWTDSEGKVHTSYETAHSHGAKVNYWLPKVNETVACLYLPTFNSDGVILGAIKT